MVYFKACSALQATELENEANQHREQIIDLGTVINAYGSQGTKRRKKNIGLYRDAREKFKDRFSTFMQLKKMSKSQKKLEERVIRMVRDLTKRCILQYTVPGSLQMRCFMQNGRL